MQIVIDISEEEYRLCKKQWDTECLDPLMMAVKYGTPIPDNATNGDVLKAMFPNVITQEFAMTIHATTKVISNGVKGGISYDFWKDWWNSPYQKGGK